MGTGTRRRCNSDIVILTPIFQILVTNLYPSPPDRNEGEVLDFRNSVSIPLDSDFPSTEQPRHSQSPSIRSLEPQYPTRETRPILAPFSQSSHVTSTGVLSSLLLFVFSFFSYIFPSSSLDIFSFRK